MIEVGNNKSEAEAGGGYCSACGIAIDDGKITVINYGQPYRTNMLRICPKCRNELIVKLSAHNTINATGMALEMMNIVYKIINDQAPDVCPDEEMILASLITNKIMSIYFERKE